MASPSVMKEESAELITPDRQFIKDVLRLGGDSAKKCFQCGTCTAMCNVSYAKNNDQSFPRQVMLHTQWGLKDKVLRDPSIWACHQCNDCSANCPRGARPGDVLAALRALAIERYSAPNFMARAYRDPRFLPLIFGIPFVVIVSLLYLFGVTFPSGEVIYKHFIPEIYVEITGVIVAGLAALAAALGLWRFWSEMELPPAVASPAAALAPAGPGAMTATAASAGSLPGDFAQTAADIALHKDFRACEADRSRTWGHLAALYGFPLLIFATGLSFLYGLFGIDQQHQPFTDPMKIAGNVGGFLVLVGVAILMYNRLKARGGAWGVATYYDWLLLFVLFLNVATGFLTQFVRIGAGGQLPYQLYVVHLSIVLATFVYVPYGKLAHLYYRAAALAAIRHGGKTSHLNMTILLLVAVGVAVGIAAIAAGLVGGIFWLLGGGIR